MYKNPAQTYDQIDRQTMSGRDVEIAVLIQAAKRLEECEQNWEKVVRNGKLLAALKYNQNVWSIFQAELEKEENPLPNKLRLDLLMLIRFLDRRILEVMHLPAPEKLKIVIDINRNIAAGIREQNVQF